MTADFEKRIRNLNISPAVRLPAAIWEELQALGEPAPYSFCRWIVPVGEDDYTVEVRETPEHRLYWRLLSVSHICKQKV